MCLYNTGLTCDTASTHTCLCQATNSYWSATLNKCLTYRTYTQSCDATYLCNINQPNLACIAAPYCICPTTVGANSCDCPMTPTQYYWDTSALGEFFYLRIITAYFWFIIASI